MPCVMGSIGRTIYLTDRLAEGGDLIDLAAPTDATVRHLGCP